MAAIYTRRLFAVRGRADGAGLHVWTVPGGQTTILRFVAMRHFDATPADVRLYVVASSGNHYLIAHPGLESNTGLLVDLRQELLAGEEVRAFSTATSDLDVLATGFVFKDL